jgi:tetratricopeptide (TPR) repeat protein
MTAWNIWTLGGVLVLALVGPASAPRKDGPRPSPPRVDAKDGELPPPPEDDGAGDEDGDEGGEPELTEEERLRQRMIEFDGHMTRANDFVTRGKHEDAAREFSAALKIIPGDSQALLGRALARKAKLAEGQCARSALRDLLALEKEDPKGDWVEQRSTALLWMRECGSRYAGRMLSLARELAAEPPGSPGRDDDIRVMLAELLYGDGGVGKAPAEEARRRRSALAELEQYQAECEAEGRNPSAAGLRLAADLYREEDELEKASELFAKLARLHPRAPEAANADKQREEIEFEQERRILDKTSGIRPSEAAEAAYNRGIDALREGRFDAAEREFTAALEESPWFPRAYYSRGVARARLGKLEPAVGDLNSAIRMDRSDYQAHMTLGLIYKREFAGAEDSEAIRHLSLALQLRPDLYRLHLLLGELYARTDREKAREHYQRFMNEMPLDDDDARLARKKLEELEREIRKEEPLPIPPPAGQVLRFLDPELQGMINEAYLRGTEHQDWEVAEKILLEARDRFPTNPEVLNELARVVYHQERFGEARHHWEASLAMREDQGEVHERLGILLREDLPADAISHLRQAAALGSLTARFMLAELLWEENEWLDAREQLERYMAEASAYDLHWERAQRLRDEIDAWFFRFYLAAGVLLTLLVVVPTWRVYRHYRGASLRQLLERAPKSFPEVARILSLIRHEILKHNTAFLADVGQALEYDATDAEQRAEVLGRRLFGDAPIGRRQAPGGIHGRFLGYVDELEKVGRAYQVTLNLHRKDPIFRPMLQAFEQLAKWGPTMRSPTAMREGRKLDLARTLRRSGHVLGRQAFEHLSSLLRELCVTNVDGALVQRIYRQVAGEKQFAEAELAPLLLEGQGAPVRIFPTDLEDILANVIRNSMRSSVLYARPPVGLGIELGTEVDEITGLGSLAIRIKDRSPEQLSNEMLRGRYVERGMGITVDLLSRYDGSIAVESQPGWSKAVVLRFFIVEGDALSVAEAAQ